MLAPSDPPRLGAYRFSGHVLDLGARRLYGPQGEIALEPRPLALLVELLHRAGRVVSKQELLDRIWAGRDVSEGALARAVRVIRAALGEPVAQCLRTVHGTGYRWEGEVAFLPVATDPLGLAAGRPLPGAPRWTLHQALPGSTALCCWRVVSATGEQRDVMLASDAAGLARLRRRCELARRLAAQDGERSPLPAALELREDTVPYWLASEPALGGSLIDWAQRQGGLAAVEPARRLALAIAVADALARAHALGVLHGALSAERILFAAEPDFEGGRLPRVWIDGLGDPPTVIQTGPGGPPGLAPECRAGAPATLASDVYALGLLLLELLGADFDCRPVPGWERLIADPLLCEDLAAALEPDPELRLRDAAELARRLRSLDQRRALARERRREQAQLIAARRSARRLRLALAAACAGLLALGLVLAGGLLLHQRASEAQALAEARATEAEAIRQFVTHELLREASPYRGSAYGEGLVGALQRAAPLIAERFADRPRVAAELERWLGDLLLDLDQYRSAGRLLAHAAERYLNLDGPLHPRTLWTRYQLAISQQRAGQIDQARALLGELAGQAQGLWPDSYMAIRIRRSLAELELRHGEPEQAVGLLASLESLPPATVAGLPTAERLRLLRLRVEQRLDAGELDQAAALLDELEAGLHGPLLPGSVEALHFEQARAELAWRQGGGEPALQAAAETCAALAQRFGPAHHETVEAVLRYAALTQRAQQPALAERLLRSTLRLTPDDDWRSPALRRALADDAGPGAERP